MTQQTVRRVLVTGGGGYIGSVLVRMLLQQGYEVRVLDRLFWGEQPLMEWRESAEVVLGDIRTMDDSVLDGMEAVVHMAGLSNDPTAEYNPDANWQMNAIATERLAEACMRKGIARLTFGSSCSVYDGLAADLVHDETANLAPRGAYAQSKFWAECRLRRLAGRNFHPVILRQGTVYGPSPRMRFDLVVNTFVKDALRRGKLMLHGGGWMSRPLVAVEDVARAHIAALEAPEELVAGQVFNVVYTNYQIRELAMLVAGSVQLREGRIELEEAPAPALVRNYRCSNRKLSDRLGVTPTVSVTESIESMLDMIDRKGLRDLDNPNYYNIQWMSLLESVFPSLKPFESVY
jgi:nucleoside-diphosphate-sugar epimerase